MAQLLKKIEGEFLPSIETDVIGLRTIYSEIQGEDFVNLRGFIAYLQNFSQIENTAKLDKPINMGLVNITNTLRIDLQINY
jgi:hypothetical protein